MPRISLTKKELVALKWFEQHFNMRKGQIHTQHRDGIKTILDKLIEETWGDGDKECNTEDNQHSTANDTGE